MTEGGVGLTALGREWGRGVDGNTRRLYEHARTTQLYVLLYGDRICTNVCMCIQYTYTRRGGSRN